MSETGHRRGGDERRLRGEERERKSEEKCHCRLGRHQAEGFSQLGPRYCDIHTHTYTLSISVTHSPHVDQAATQEGVQAPVDVGQAGDVEDFMTQASGDQEEDVQQPVPHLVLMCATALQRINTAEHVLDQHDRTMDSAGVRPDHMLTSSSAYSHTHIKWVDTCYSFNSWSIFTASRVAYTFIQNNLNERKNCTPQKRLILLYML